MVPFAVLLQLGDNEKLVQPLGHESAPFPEKGLVRTDIEQVIRRDMGNHFLIFDQSLNIARRSFMSKNRGVVA